MQSIIRKRCKYFILKNKEQKTLVAFIIFQKHKPDNMYFHPWHILTFPRFPPLLLQRFGKVKTEYFYYYNYLPVIAGEIALNMSSIGPTSCIVGNFFETISFVVGIMIICKVPCFGSEKMTSLVA